MEAAKTQQWILTQSNGFYVKVWLQLLPFVDRPVEGLAVLLGLPPEQRDAFFVRDLVGSYAQARSSDAEEVLFKLAEADAQFYGQHEWRDAVVAIGTASSAQRLIDLAASGVLCSKSSDDHQLIRQLGGLLAQHENLRGRVYGLLKDGAISPGLAMLASAVAENPDEAGLLVLVNCEQRGRSFGSGRTIQRAVTEHVPFDGSPNAYNVVPVPAVDLRRKLIAITTDGGAKDVAARWLTEIDHIRDDYGAPSGEPRHPDLSSGKPWPIITAPPKATTQ